jgi:gluconate 5-dehydrogenase
MFNLKGRNVVVSGASSGLGAQMAKGFAKQGADVIILARRLEKLEALAKEIKSIKCGVYCIKMRRNRFRSSNSNGS